MIQANVELSDKNTLRLPATAQWFAQPSSEQQLQEILNDPSFTPLPRTVIGDGSNLLIHENIDGLVIKPAMRGISVIEESSEHVLIEVMAGENWDQLVDYTLAQGWQGLENLSLIPGSVGAAPFQNIGAYGVELVDVFESLDAMSVADAQLRNFSKQQCGFSYRDSFFKSVQPGQCVITRVRLRLNKIEKLTLSNADLAERFSALAAENQSAHGVRELICALRRSKLPDPAELANAGSFFKNPVVSSEKFESLQRSFPSIVGYPQPHGAYKLAAGWLIEQAQWKGKREGSVGMHAQQALVLVNYGGATGADVMSFAKRVQDSIAEIFSVTLEREPVLLPRALPKDG